jgi:hypothetical protein
MQEEPLSIIKLDASSRKAGAFKGDDVLLLLRTLNNPPEADGLRRWKPPACPPLEGSPFG